MINKENPTKNLISIIENTPLALRPTIKIKNLLGEGFHDIYLVKGLTMETPLGEKGVALSYECDNMTETLVHECLHVLYPTLSEKDVVKWTDMYYNTFPDVKRASQKRIVNKLNEYEVNGRMKKYEKFETKGNKVC